jgi:hypothetical protein
VFGLLSLRMPPKRVRTKMMLTSDPDGRMSVTYEAQTGGWRKGHGKGKDQEPLRGSFDLPFGSTDVRVCPIPESTWPNPENLTGTQLEWSSLL